MRTLPFAAAVVLAAACDATEPQTSHAPADPAAGEVAFELAANESAIVVPVMIDGQGPLRLVLDTGATLTCLDESVADSLELPDATGIVGMGAAVGGSGSVRMVRVDSMSVGAASATGLLACVIDLGNIQELGLDVDGLLGLNFLTEFHVALDFERNVLTLSAP